MVVSLHSNNERSKSDLIAGRLSRTSEIERTLKQLRENFDSLASTPVEHLFDLADRFAASGDFEAKEEVYQRFILLHPEVSTDQLMRIRLFELDTMSRFGEPLRALEGLSKIRIDPDLNSPETQFNYYETLAWAAAGAYDIYAEEHFKELALDSARKLLKTARALQDSLSSVQSGQAFEVLGTIKMRFRQIDSEFLNAMQTSERLADELPIDASKVRAYARVEGMRGFMALEKNSYESAIEHFRCLDLLSDQPAFKLEARLGWLLAVGRAKNIQLGDEMEHIKIDYTKYVVEHLPRNFSVLAARKDQILELAHLHPELRSITTNLVIPAFSPINNQRPEDPLGFTAN